jgi:CxxC motif-containing protein (DUF1111 family)
MSVASRMRPVHWVVVLLALAPAWKAAEWAWGSRIKVVDPQAAQAGEVLFRHEWTANDSLASGDGLGPVFNARSCVDCHNQGGVGGGGPVDKNVTVYGLASNADVIKISQQKCVSTPAPLPDMGIPVAGVVHQKAISPGFQETLRNVHPSLPGVPSLPLAEILGGHGSTMVPGVLISQRNTPALFGDGLIDAVSDEAIIAHQREHSDAARLVGLNGARDGKVRGRVARLVDGRIGRFGWKGEFSHLGDFVKAACANELGLSNPGRPQPTPLGKLHYKPKGGDDLTDAQCELMTDYLRALALPIEQVPVDSEGRNKVKAGKDLFTSIGCADCHSPKLGPVAGLYSDLLLHDMGSDLEASPGTYGELPVPSPQFDGDTRPNPAEWRTPPLWGVADSAPYLHDGRAATLREAIEKHGGEASGVAQSFGNLAGRDQEAVLSFLKTLRAPGAAEVNIAAK